MPEQWTFRGTDLSTYAYLVASADGVDDLPPMRGEDLVVPGIPGRRFLPRMADARRFPLALWVLPDNAAGTRDESTNRKQARVNLDALLAILGNSAEGALVRTMPNASTRTAQAVCVATDGIRDGIDEIIGLVADFSLADPFFYGATITDAARAISASPTNFTFTNTGSQSARKMTFDFTGPISNPRIANLTLDAGGAFYVEALVTVATGMHLIINVGAWTATNDGVDAIGSIRHSGAFEFFRIAPGANSLRVTATTPGGTLTTAVPPPYL